MAADATTLLNVYAAKLLALYDSAIPVKISKRKTADGKPMYSGWTPGFPTTCFIVSEADPETIDSTPSFEHVSVGYGVLTEYVKPSMQVVSTGATPAPVAEDPDIRDKRQTLRQTFYVPYLTGIGNLFDVRVKTRGIYDLASDGPKLLATGLIFTFSLWEPRPGS